MKCKYNGCKHLLGVGEYYYCTNHQLRQKEIKTKKEDLVNFRKKDPFYIQDLKIFLKASECIKQREDDSYDEMINYGDEEQIYWVISNLHTVMFKYYYLPQEELRFTIFEGIQIGKTRTEMIVNYIKMIKENLYRKTKNPRDIKNNLHEYECYTKFLTRWIEEHQFIEKNLLINEFELVDDIHKMVMNIINKL